ncbi:hypothetical protein N658DRAFT_483032 [Parathielavia hyrcaniae]|uniref:feruloyl esterase n=1 Tax=Parathielavia hyrcaniae TaxID=113614 RepID=A0AAN6T5K0_9PEZI|nr:hypothetical protein N658DRAFT_483032 [Parathielavia hyrcaniae]
MVKSADNQDTINLDLGPRGSRTPEHLSRDVALELTGSRQAREAVEGDSGEWRREPDPGARRIVEASRGVMKRRRPSISDILLSLPCEFLTPTTLRTSTDGLPNNDTAFTSEILDALESKLCLNSSRIFATGKSDGAGFVCNVLAYDAVLSSRIAAFAPLLMCLKGP